MNVLADEQLKLFEENLTEEEKEKRNKEFLELYYKLRNKDDSRFYSKLSLEQRRKIHSLILGVYKIKNKLGGLSYDLLKDEREQTDRPIIFAVTHVGKFDIEVLSEAIKDHYYLLSGDYEHIQGIIDAPFIALNGVFYFNENVKEDRRNVVDKMVNHLKEGGNLLYFPEGTWNVKESLPVLPCYWGIVDVAKKGNAIVLPIAAEQVGKKFIVNVGKNIDFNTYEDTKEDKTKAITELRDTLATLKWEIFESRGNFKREDIKPNEWDEYQQERFKEWPYFSNEYINRLIYKPKNQTTNEEAFSHVKKLVPNKNNAFLFDKNNHD